MSLTSPQMTTPDGFIRLAGPIERDNIVNGDGLRAVIWTQGCRQFCPGCQNPETWGEDEGELVAIERVKEILRGFKGQQGLTFCGGEPLLQARECLAIADWARAELGWNIWSFTGLVYENIKRRGGVEWDFVRSLDALIDGPYVQAERDLTMKFRGSSTQRILYLKNGEIIRSE
jgi:anaerobic ribonucleoside-triphosphate reductase activating protein